ncbi:MAG TPA: hypothetical protein ENI96_01230 [Sedimenticola thiotaurini]|uniref:Rhodanese domain-containing protein n=1 Tax=Sedimenticola thiotaurini TaxID=1543721 RepID=A0A831RIV5_9GAMM|nr:hypothetical protein [Sedimenticola thiotaurini]
MRPLLLLVASVLLSAILLAEPGWPQIAPRQLSRLLHEPVPPLLLDIRGRGAYLAGTLPQALNAGTDPAGFLPDGRGGDVVLISDDSVERERLAAWIRRLTNAHHRVFILQGGVAAWRAAGLPLVQAEQNYVRPGTVPFIIPRGLCEGDEPAQEYR